MYQLFDSIEEFADVKGEKDMTDSENDDDAAVAQMKIVVAAICKSAFAAEAHRHADEAVETEQIKFDAIMARRRYAMDRVRTKIFCNESP